MKEYSFLELDYKDLVLEKEIDFLKKKLESIDPWVEKINKDPFLCQLPEKSKQDLAIFISDCDCIAQISKGEFSLSIHPDTDEVSVVILSKEIHLRFPWCAVFSDISLMTKHFHIEPVEENGLKLMIYANRLLGADEDRVPFAEKSN